MADSQIWDCPAAVQRENFSPRPHSSAGLWHHYELTVLTGDKSLGFNDQTWTLLPQEESCCSPVVSGSKVHIQFTHCSRSSLAVSALNWTGCHFWGIFQHGDRDLIYRDNMWQAYFLIITFKMCYNFLNVWRQPYVLEEVTQVGGIRIDVGFMYVFCVNTWLLKPLMRN